MEEPTVKDLNHKTMTSTTVFSRATEAANSIRAALPSPLHNPHLAIVCGSGLGNLQHSLLPSPFPRVEIQWSDIPHFPTATGE